MADEGSQERPAQVHQAAKGESLWQLAVRSFLRSKTAIAGMAIVVSFLVLAAVGPYVAPYDPIDQNLRGKLKPPTSEHWMGTDELGRDILSRILYGARISVTLSLTAVSLAVLMGVPIGLISAYQGGIWDRLICGTVDVFLAFPTYLLAIFIMSIVGPTLTNIALAVCFSTVPRIVRVVRGDTLEVKAQEMVLAARCIGAPAHRILFRHILPNIISSVVVVATLRLGTAILVESSLSFLGLGLSPPTPAWGLMVNQGLRYLSLSPHLAIFPGLAIMALVLGFNLFGDGVRDALDPRMRGAET